VSAWSSNITASHDVTEAGKHGSREKLLTTISHVKHPAINTKRVQFNLHNYFLYQAI